MIPAREVGGDFYDFFLLDEARLGVVIGDVSGKGVPAALFMATSRTLLKSTALVSTHVGACLQQVNCLLSTDNDNMMFVSLFYGILHLQSGTLEYGNAGHHAPYVLTADGTVTALPLPRGLVLGLDEQFVYPTSRVSIAPGSTLLLYTDGITEAFNKEGEVFSEERLQTQLRQAAGQTPRQLLQDVIQAVRQFADGAPQSDDLTMLAVTYFGAAAR